MTRLSILYILLSFFLQLSLFSSPVAANQIVFDNVGQLAGAVAYAHVVVPLDIRATVKQSLSLRSALESRFHEHQSRISATDQIATANDIAHLLVIAKHLEETDLLFERLGRLQQYFPFDFKDITFPPFSNASAQADLILDQNTFPTKALANLPPRSTSAPALTMTLSRTKRVVPFLPLIIGAAKLGTSLFSTVNGLYSRGELKQLRHQLQGILAQQRRVIQLATSQTVAIVQLSSNLRDLYDKVALALLKAPAISSAEVNFIIHGLHRAITLVFTTVQQAQDNRLAIEFLSPAVLASTYKDVVEASTLNQCSLLLEQPADLSQVEVSYISDEDGTVIVLHVPMIPQDALLRLMRIRPFPIPLDNQSALIPSVIPDVIGISDADKKLSAEIRYSDLLECHKIGKTFYCERQNILTRNANTCLTALHNQDLTRATQLCELKIVDAEEAVMATAPQQFLVFSPKASTAQRTCIDFGQGASVSIPKGISTVTLPSGCHLDLTHHRVYADNSIHISAHQFSYNWDWDATIAKLGTNQDKLALLAANLRNSSGPLHLSDVLAYTNELTHHQQILDQQARQFNTTVTSHFQTLLSSFTSDNLNFALSSSALSIFSVFALGSSFLLFRFRRHVLGNTSALRSLVTRIPDLKNLIQSTNARTLYPSLNPIFDEMTKFQDQVQHIMNLLPTIDTNARVTASAPSPDSGVNLSH